MSVLIAALVGCVWVVGAKLFPQLGHPLKAGAALLVIALFASTIRSILRTPDLETAAVLSDLRLGTKERLVSSLQLAQAQGPMMAALHRDAIRALEGKEPADHFPLTFTRPMRWVFAPIVLFGLLYQLPELDVTKYRQRQAEAVAKQQATQVKVERLKTLAQSLKPPKDQPNPEMAQLATKVERIAEELQSGSVNDKQATAKLSNLAKEMEKINQQFQEQAKNPLQNSDLSQMGAMAKDLALAIQQNDFKAATEKLSKLREQLKQGDLSPAQKDQLQKDMQQLSEEMKKDPSSTAQQLSQQLGQTASNLQSGDNQAAQQQMQQAEQSLSDMQSALDQLKQLEQAQQQMQQTQQAMMCKQCNGAGCSKCQGKKPGDKAGSQAGPGQGQGKPDGQSQGGLSGQGKGRGNQVGPLPDRNVGFSPTVAPGPVTPGKVLASIIQKGAPETDAQSSIENVDAAFTQVRQEAESALTKEEIPPGAKEYVREYFSAIDPNEQGDRSEAPAETGPAPSTSPSPEP